EVAVGARRAARVEPGELDVAQRRRVRRRTAARRRIAADEDEPRLEVAVRVLAEALCPRDVARRGDVRSRRRKREAGPTPGRTPRHAVQSEDDARALRDG